MSACQNCKGTLTNECGEFVFAPCVIVQSNLTEISAFFEEECVTLHDLIPEIYEILEFLDLEDYDGSCLDLPDEPTHLEIEQAQTDAICDIQENLIHCVSDILEIPYNSEGCTTNLDTSCLFFDDCKVNKLVNPSNFGELMGALIDKICELQDRITELENNCCQ